MSIPKRPIGIRAYYSEELARLVEASLKTLVPKARNGHSWHPANKLWIVASDATREQFDTAAEKAWDIHCRKIARQGVA